MNIPELLQAQTLFFKSEQTKNVAYRKATLKRLQKILIKKEVAVVKALHDDFKKSEYESVMTETAIVLSELKRTIKNIDAWNKPECILPWLLNFPSSDNIYKEPYGKVLVISPWNYPYQLALLPLIGAVASGNTVMLKPSELAPNTSKVLEEILTEAFDKNHVATVLGGVAISQELLAKRWDYIFFTGSVPVGKIVAKAAANHLTPVTLELGGKNPCIVGKTANIRRAAKRIVWGKCINAGQTCIAPDYLLVHKSIKTIFVANFKEELSKAYGDDIQQSADYPRIINSQHFDRLKQLLINQRILIEGKLNREDLFIAPTLIDEPDLKSELMQNEIFGPLLPIITYENEQDIQAVISCYEKPLALYVFSNQRGFIKKIIQKYAFGGGVINDTTVHFASHRLPFGGVGQSGMGSYHGKRTFDTFSHRKSVVKRYNWLDIPIRYAPYKGKLKLLKMLMRRF